MSLEGKTPEEIAAMAELADSLMGDPATNGQFQRLLKKQNPKLSMPLIDLEDKAAAAFAARDKRIEELEGKLAQRDAGEGANTLYEHMRDAGFVTTRQSFSDLCKYANDKGFMCTEMGLRNASQLRAQEETAAEPTPQTINHGQFAVSDSADLSKSFFRDPKGTAATQAAQAMTDLAKMRLQNGARKH